MDTTGVSEQYNNTRVFFPASVRIPGTIGCGYKHQIQKHECGRQVIPDTVSSIKSGLKFNGDKLDLWCLVHYELIVSTNYLMNM